MALGSLRPTDPVEVRRRFVVSAFLVPTAVAVVGAALMALGCVPMATWGLHVLALVPALGLGLLVSRAGPGLRRYAPLAAVAALLPLAATLAAPGIDGVHRWLAVGPVHLHASAILAPLIVAGLGGLAARGRWWPFAALLVAAQALHVAQPDAGQAFAVALGAAVAALVAPGKGPARAAMILVAVVAGVAARFPADPLAPVRHAEGILELAAARGLGLWLLARAFLAVLALPPFLGVLHALAARERGAAAVAAGLFGYEVGAILAPALGAFPVPVLGFGASHLVGFVLANGLIVAIVRGLPLPAPARRAAPALAAEPPAAG